MVKAIETAYNGYRFRSRLEARWAVYFDALDVAWLYEEEGFDLGALGRYLPDFWFPKWGAFGEVKPKEFTPTERAKAAALPHNCILFVGMPDSTNSYEVLVKFDPEPFRVILPRSAERGRLWYDYGETAASYGIDLSADRAAKAARFEFGEHP